MNPKYLRFGLALVLVGFLFVFFVPVVYSSNLSNCQMPPHGGYNGTYWGVPCLLLSNPAGLKSIGVVLFGWGAVYGFEEGYSASMVPWGGAGFLTTFGVLMLVVLPTAVASVCCLAPEIVRKSLPTRTGFTLFGGFVFVLSILMFASMMGEGFNQLLATDAVILFSLGSLMVVYGIRPKTLQVTADESSQP